MKKNILFLLICIFCSSLQIKSQTYYPMGIPDKWQVSVTPFLWLPAISGSVESNLFENETKATAMDILSNIKMAFMMQAEVSKGKFFVTPSYIYTKLGTEKTSTQEIEGEPAIIAMPVLKMNIAELVVGMRFPLSEKFILDAYVGTRYDNFKTTVTLERYRDTTEKEAPISFWDPVIGVRAHYFPHPRVPITVSADVGGLGPDLKLSWTTTISAGYTVSPLVDLFLGFNAYGIDYKTYSALNNPISIKMNMYGLNMGARFFFQKRDRDPSVFKEEKKN